MTDVAPIDPTDPLLEPFSLQFDFRERYQHALEEILKISKAETDREWAAEEMTRIATEALSEDKIREWQEMGRPLPWIDEAINPLAMKVRDEVMKAMGLS